jgi:hypothetical protein
MAPTIRTYPTPDAARQAVEELRAAGVQAHDIRLLTSEPFGGTSGVARGGFAGPVGPDAAVGAFAGPPRRHGEARGSFATGSVSGERPSPRKGSFADVERVAVVTYQEDTERSRVTGYRGIRKLLRRSALDEDALNKVIDVLHSGHSVVLVAALGLVASEVWARFEGPAEAA